MRWQPGPGDEPGDGRDGASGRDPRPSGGRCGPARPARDALGDQVGGGVRDERLAGFAQGGAWDTCPPGPGLVAVAAEVSGPEWRCPGATDDELIGLVRQWAAVESWAAAAKLGVVRELIRREDQPWLPGERHGDLPDSWGDSLQHELSLALASSVQAADRTAWLAWDLRARLPGVDALLTRGVLTQPKARAVAEAFQCLSDDDAARAEALIRDQLAGKTYLQVARLAAQAAATVDPDSAEKRRKTAERDSARVRLWREQSGAAALAGFDLPTDETLAAHANVSARAGEYQESKAFPDVKMDQFRAMAYLDLLNGVTAEARISRAVSSQPSDGSDGSRPHSSCPDGSHPDDGPSGGPFGEDGPGEDGLGGDGPGGDGYGEDGPHDGDSGGDSPGGDGPGGAPGGGSPDGRRPAGPGSAPAAPLPRTDLVIPFATLLGLANRPGEAHGLGTLDPDLCRDLAAAAVNSPSSTLCVTITDRDGIAIGHGCARPARARRQLASQASREGPGRSLAALAARVNLTVSYADIRRLAARPGRPGNARQPGQASPWTFTPRDDPGPPGGYGTWTLTQPGGRELTVRLEPVPTFGCDHRHESHAYQPNHALRHLVQVRDGDCTFPSCSRHARESDFEHALPYDKGGRTCACNAGARSRKCHRVKQSPGWDVTQPRPGYHEWITPAGRSYTQGPKRYPA